MNKLFLDMDGVLSDFVGGISKAHGRSSPYEKGGGRGVFDMERIWGISQKEFWNPPKSDLGFDFWNELEKTPEADEIVALASEKFGEENICILTAPSLHPSCIPGKQEWIKRYYPQFNKRLIFASAGAKKFLSGPDKFLIDDKDTNVIEFGEGGGTGILVPRPWNLDHVNSDRIVEILKHLLERIR